MKFKKHILSKSTFLRGINCEKSLWLNKFHKDLKDPISPAQQASFDKGNRVGELAQQLFPNGKDATPLNFWDYKPSIEKTIDWIKAGENIVYEAAFQYDAVLSALDILTQSNSGEINAYEVKSSTNIKEYHILDAALQYFVMTNSGYQPKDFFLVIINNEYIKQGELAVNQYFKIESVLNQVLELQNFIKDNVTKLKYTLAVKQLPAKKIGPHCKEPHTCDFIGHCWSHIPEYSIFNLSRIGKQAWDLYELGYLKTTVIPDELDTLSDNQYLQIISDKEQKKLIDTTEVKNFLESIEYPAYYMDFETFAPAIPIYDGTKPYEKIPFQYSIHVSYNDINEELNHYEYLAYPPLDPRKEFIERLIQDLGTEGSIIVYNAAFEKSVLNACKDIYPELSEKIDSIIERILDLMIIFQKKHYYTPEMQGSFSIKKVLPALVPNLNYDSLEISSGTVASDQFEKMLLEPSTNDNQITRENLLEYCEQDTIAMVEIVKVLQNSIS